MHILSKLSQPRRLFRPIYNRIILNQYTTITKECNKSKQILFRQQIIYNPIGNIFNSFQKAGPIKLKQADGVPDYYELIYRNALYNYFLAVQILSSVLGVLALILIPILYEAADVEDNIHKNIPVPKTNEGLILGIILIGSCVSMHILLRKCPMRIYNLPKSNNYVFVFYGNVPFSIKKLPGRVNDIVHIGKESPVIPWAKCYYSVRNYDSKIIMFENFFRKPADLHIMLGIQKNDELDDDN